MAHAATVRVDTVVASKAIRRDLVRASTLASTAIVARSVAGSSVVGSVVVVALPLRRRTALVMAAGARMRTLLLLRARLATGSDWYRSGCHFPSRVDVRGGGECSRRARDLATCRS